MRLLALCAVLVAALVGPSAAAAWTWPVGGSVLRPYSLGADAYAAGQHRGVDVLGSDGEPVLAPATGVVSFSGTVPTHGRTVTIQTADGLAVSLTHLGQVAAARGDSVAEGTLIGVVGTSGEPEWPSPYVHLGIRVGAGADAYVDPMTLLPPRPVFPPPADTASPAPAPEPAPAPAPAPAGSPAPVVGPVATPSTPLPAPGLSLPTASPALESATGTGQLQPPPAAVTLAPAPAPVVRPAAPSAQGTAATASFAPGSPAVAPRGTGASSSVGASRAHEATGPRGVPSPDGGSAVTPAGAGAGDAMPVAGSVPAAIRSARPSAGGAAGAARTSRVRGRVRPVVGPAVHRDARAAGEDRPAPQARHRASSLPAGARRSPRVDRHLASLGGVLLACRIRRRCALALALALAKGTEPYSYDDRRCPSPRRSWSPWPGPMRTGHATWATWPALVSRPTSSRAITGLKGNDVLMVAGRMSTARPSRSAAEKEGKSRHRSWWTSTARRSATTCRPSGCSYNLFTRTTTKTTSPRRYAGALHGLYKNGYIFAKIRPAVLRLDLPVPAGPLCGGHVPHLRRRPMLAATSAIRAASSSTRLT